jgi:hypothetical protein
MTDRQFDERLGQIEADYAGRRLGAEAFRDQEVARLFVECGWTQERIAKRMGWSQGRVAQRLIFGRFLNYYGRNNSESPPHSLGEWHVLTEWRFRDAWRQSGKGHRKETEDERFARVRALLDHLPPGAPPKGYLNLVKKPGIRAAVAEALTGRTRQSVEDIAEALRECFPDIDSKQISEALQSLQKKPPKGFAFDARHVGRSHKYRLVERRGPLPAAVNPEEAGGAVAEALPLVKECIDILRKPEVGRQTTLALDHLWKIQQLLKRLLVAEGVV